jgi:hypothetical protein
MTPAKTIQGILCLDWIPHKRVDPIIHALLSGNSIGMISLKICLCLDCPGLFQLEFRFDIPDTLT